MKQSEAIFQAVQNTYNENGVHFEEGMDVESTFTKELRGQVHEIVCEGFQSGRIDFADTPSNKAKLADRAKLSAYVSGLISNWVRKDPRLNGSVKYVAKNPGSRAGQSDEQMKTLRALAKQFAGTEKEGLINAQIEKRRTELAAAKSKSVTLTDEQLSKLDPSVREALGI